ncbi:DUF1345 domain-containing protein [Pseudorhodoferax sp. Leaf267]|uniref:DUF1345 domain-containing protein n=1 Tax=Pseudorhodoferax sp. Leaf267 TaxID=1736316 RepID=UPI0006F2F840|nr:DUF1345 domain-containing protein [Pseudorhodoferax sp. Leaf267]KQP22462.1 hypothetical protein ASF43_00570 [Pseudorhodoferax sp. Leaf267]
MRRLLHHLRVRPYLAGALATGAAAAVLAPGQHDVVTRALIGWNVAVWLYLVLLGWMMVRADHGRVQRAAVAQAESAGTVLALVSLASIFSLVGVVFELSAAKVPGVPHAWPHVVFALATVAGAWVLLPMVFALTYASVYYRAAGGGLRFPDDDAHFKPNYGDFLYFSFTIAVASQTSDVSVSTVAMRRVVLLQTLLSFAFNATILAFSINIAASLF